MTVVRVYSASGLLCRRKPLPPAAAVEAGSGQARHGRAADDHAADAPNDTRYATSASASGARSVAQAEFAGSTSDRATTDEGVSPPTGLLCARTERALTSPLEYRRLNVALR